MFSHGLFLFFFFKEMPPPQHHSPPGEVGPAGLEAAWSQPHPRSSGTPLRDPESCPETAGPMLRTEVGLSPRFIPARSGTMLSGGGGAQKRACPPLASQQPIHGSCVAHLPVATTRSLAWSKRQYRSSRKK